MRKRMERHKAIRTIIRSKMIRTQHEIVEELADYGFTCTQATISRDITEMGLKKTEDGCYVLAEDLALKRMLSEMLEEMHQANNLVVIKVLPGTASGVGAALDSAILPEVLGTVAGDDTILVVAESDEQAKAFVETVQRMRGLPHKKRSTQEDQ